MPAPAPTLGNAAGDDLDMPEVGTTAGLSVTMFLNEPFHTPGLNQSLSFLKAQSIFSALVIFCCENVHVI